MNREVYAGIIKDKNTLKNSSSGGAFTALSDAILQSGGVVICAIYNYSNHKVEFKLVDNTVARDSARGSKYIQSTPGNIFRESVEWLDNHPMKTLMFIGMGCQADGYRKYSEIKGFRERVIIVDIICHGSPSPKIWEDYIRSMQIINGGLVDFVTFKDKRIGWKHPVAVASIKNAEIPIKQYRQVYDNNCALRKSCYECPYATKERKTDITIGDFWHIEEKIPEFYNPMGNSLFLIHTERGKELFNQAAISMNVHKSNEKDCWQNMLERPTPRPEQRQQFWEDFQNRGIEYIVKKYGENTMRKRIKNIIDKLYGGMR